MNAEEVELLSDSKYRNYVAAVDKALKNFEYSSEWADLISALGKLNKVKIRQHTILCCGWGKDIYILCIKIVLMSLVSKLFVGNLFSALNTFTYQKWRHLILCFCLQAATLSFRMLNQFLHPVVGFAE